MDESSFLPSRNSYGVVIAVISSINAASITQIRGVISEEKIKLHKRPPTAIS